YSANYAPYGEIISTTGTDTTPFKFTGEEMDDSGLVYLRARYLNPVIAQFFSLDPLETPNRYQYVAGNPITRRDPSGMDCIGEDCIDTGGAAVLVAGDGSTEVFVPESGTLIEDPVNQDLEDQANDALHNSNDPELAIKLAEQHVAPLYV